jgi:pimeloyl-ACP methyl ester carboxylesterase
MGQPTQRIIEANDIKINIAEQGTGPLVLLCHGFPECWYSWRHQIPAIAEAGFQAVARFVVQNGTLGYRNSASSPAGLSSMFRAARVREDLPN